MSISELIRQRVREARDYPNEPIEHLTEDLVDNVKQWALEMVGEDHPVDPANDEFDPSFNAIVKQKNSLKEEIRQRIEESINE